MLKSKTIHGPAPGAHLLISAGVHGDEFEPMATVRALIQKLDPKTLRGRVTLIPCVNESAFHRGSRVGEDGLDLARVCPGKPDGSITERAAHSLSEFIRSADAYIDLHTGGSALRLAPLAGYMLHTNERVLSSQRRMARAFNLPIIWGTHPAANGRSLSVARDANIPAIYTETGGGGSCDDEHIASCVDGCLNVMQEFGMIDRQIPAARIKHFVEDARDHSGHLQIQHPAPMQGFFEPAVKLEQSVNQGDVIGTVCDVLGEKTETVRASESGVILMLRWFRHVNAQDALAAILPTEFERPE
jgi:predicted deacylase